jgi:hypothetical protein
MKVRAAIVGLALVLLIGVGLALCQAPLQAWRSLASVRQVDDYSLYVMRYYGDYGFARFLRRGIGQGQAGLPSGEFEQSWACTGFAAMDPASDAIMGRNFDWHNRQTLLLFTDPPDGYASVSMVDVSYLDFPRENPSWADRRSLLEAPYLPFDGMNERGLAVGMMAVPRAQDRDEPQRVTISSIHAIRLMLDYAADVEEAIALLEGYTIDFGSPPIHYFVADASGHSAVIEYLDGKMAVLRNEKPWQVSTNFILAEESPTGADSPCWRYNLAYEMLEQKDGDLSQTAAMSLLQDVSQRNTMWSVVYDVTNGDIQVAMGRQYDQVHSFELRMLEQ